MILVTGADEIKGIHIVVNLLQRGAHVCVANIDSHTLDCFLDYYGVRHENISYADVDFSDYQSIADIDESSPLHGIDVIFHCADTDMISTRNVVRLAQQKGVKLCYVGSAEAIGTAEHGAMSDEQTPWQPDSHRSTYAKQKFFQEMEIWRGIYEGLQAVVICAGIAIGPTPRLGRDAHIMDTIRTSKHYFAGEVGVIDARDLAEIAIDAINNTNCIGERYIAVGHNAKYADLQNAFADKLSTLRPSSPSKIGKMFDRIFRKNNELDEVHTYNAQKLQDAVHHDFRSIDDTINNVANYIKNDETDYD